MKISYDWLKDYIKIDKSPAELADDLSLFGHEVESVEKLGDDYVLDFEITPNRGDCLSILGMAREIAALHNSELRIKNYEVKETDINKKISVIVFDLKICPRYTARVIDNTEIKESPKWIKEKLATYGFRSINNIVDITNYVMVATGQPMHAFDYDKIKDGLMNLRFSKKGEEVTTLDGKNYVLPDGAAIIEDHEKIYDLAGIMGGYKSEVDEKTKTIILQAAIFDPKVIRKASKYLNCITDASYRYERGVDSEGPVLALDMAIKLIIETSSQANVGELVDIGEKYKPTRIEIEPDKINHLLGIKLSSDEINGSLKRLGFKITDNSALVPSFRFYDIKIWQDLAEEVARIHGYNNLGKNNLDLSSANVNREFTSTEKLKDILVELGFTEIYSYSFAEKNKLELLGFNPDDQPQIEKPLSPETEYLRPSLLPSLLSAIARNPWSPEVNIFEMEAVFSKTEEKWQLGIATIGKSDAILQEALKSLNLGGKIENVDQKILDQYKIRRAVKYIIVDIEKIKLPIGDYSLEISQNKYKPISKYPPTVRDLAFIVASEVKASDIIQTILKVDKHILLAECFDEFSSEKFGSGKKNVAFHIWLQDVEKVLSDTETTNITKKIIDKISSQYNATLRS
jgi:phenylalanyl-tRNA synthetase beta chain